MELTIKNFDKLDIGVQKEIQDHVAGFTSEFIISNRLESLMRWIAEIKLKQDYAPTHIDINKIIDLIECGEIKDSRLELDLNQKTLTELFN